MLATKLFDDQPEAKKLIQIRWECCNAAHNEVQIFNKISSSESSGSDSEDEKSRHNSMIEVSSQVDIFSTQNAKPPEYQNDNLEAILNEVENLKGQNQWHL